MFIVIDGIDGSGKGTQVALLEKKLIEMWKKVKILDYPRYGKPPAFAVEKYLNGEYGNDVSAKQASIFYALDRFDHSLELQKDIQEYDFIISNRYVSANMIHQAGKISDPQEREDFLDWLYDLEFNIFGIKKPDRTIFLNVSPQMSQKLVLLKQDRAYLKAESRMDIHEADTNHLENAHAVAMDIVSKYPDWIKIDCEISGKMKQIEAINDEILEIIL